MQLLEAGAGALFAIAGLGVLGWSSALAAARVLPRARGSVRLGAAIVFAHWQLGVLFWALVSVGAFNRFAGLFSLGLAALMAHRTWGESGSRVLVEDARRVRRRLDGLGRADRAVLGLGVGAMAVTGGVRLLRGLATPPMATDSLTYHLLRAGRWVQSGEWAVERAPDAAAYYENYPPLGDAVWAWAMLPFSDDTMLALAGALSLAGVVVGAYALARTLGAALVPASLGALALGLNASVMVFMTTAYVDIGALAMFLIGVMALVEASRDSDTQLRRACLWIAVAALSIGAGTKVPLLVPLVLAVLVALWLLIAARARPRVVAIVLAAGVVVAAWWIRGLVLHGNPVYPFPLGIAGISLLPGNEENMLNMSGALAPEHLRQFSGPDFLRRLFWPNPEAGVQHLNFGVGGPVIFLSGLVGAVVAWRAGQRLAVAFLGLVSAVVLSSLFSDGMLAHRTFAAPAVGRLLTMLLASAVVMATLLPALWLRWLWAGAVLVAAYESWPRGLGLADVDALRDLAPWVAAMLALGGLAWGTRRRPALALASALAGGIVVLAGASLIRPQHRYTVYEAAVDAASFDPHPTDPRAGAAWPIWRRLDEESGLVIAFAAGWDGRGHHWYRYPLLGTKLQNRVVYVPATEDGDIVDYRDRERLTAAADPRAWITRLEDAEVDVLVLGPPPSIEALWVSQMPERFERFAVGEGGRGAAFWVRGSVVPSRKTQSTR